MTNIIMIILLLSPIVLPQTLSATNHAPLTRRSKKLSRKDKKLIDFGFDRHDRTGHIDAAEKFKTKYFRDKKTKKISLNKVVKFYERLQKEFEENKSKARETEILESIDIGKKAIEKALVRAQEDDVLTNVFAPYKLYLFPKLEEIIEAIKAKEKQKTIQGKLDEFILGYIPYYNPNPYDNIFKNKINIPGLLYHGVKHPKKIKRTKNVQANNLRIENFIQLKEIKNYLPHSSLKVGSFLTQRHLSHLMAKGYDISKLNPGPSPLWSNPKGKNLHSGRDQDKYFPKKGAKKIFHHVMLGGRASTKVKLGFFDEMGNERRVKLKIGPEVHSELAAGVLFKHLGFGSDKMRYVKKATFFLGNIAFENFEAEIRQKFGQEANVQFNYEEGISNSGERYVTWQDSLYEARPDEEIRIAPLDIASWDLQNRREYRGSELALAWIGANDLKPDNLKAMLVKRNDTWVVHHRFHDLGYALGPTFIIRNRKDLLNLPGLKEKVNQLETKIVKPIEGGVKTYWNEAFYQHRKYKNSTYYDYKWMARKIAAIPKNCIKHAFKISGMPKDMAHLFIIKMIKRRNNIVKVFNLENEYPLYKVPKDLKNYSPKKYPTIKKGKIKARVYEGKNVIPIRTRKLGTVIADLIRGRQMPFAQFEAALHDERHSPTGTLRGDGMAFSYHFEQDDIDVGLLGKLRLRPGIVIIPSRIVLESPQNINTVHHSSTKKNKNKNNQHSNLLYIVEDKINIYVGVGAEIEKGEILPADLTLKGEILKKTITHKHFSDSLKKAWSSAYKIPKILKMGKKKYSARKLRDLEAIETYYAIGPNTRIRMQNNWAQIITSNGFDFEGFSQKVAHKIIFRDQYGRLHYVKELFKTGKLKGEVNFLNAQLTSLQAAGLSLGRSTHKIKGNTIDYLIGVDKNQDLLTHDHNRHGQEQAKREINAFKQLKKDPYNADVILNFENNFTHGNSHLKSSLLFVLNRNKNENWSSSHYRFRNGQERKLFQATSFSGKNFGKKNITKPSELSEFVDIAVKKGKHKKTIIECEQRAPNKFIIAVNNRVFSRKEDREGLIDLIDKLNARYSDDPFANEDNFFFSDLSLPPEDEQDSYRKIYADLKAQIDGEYLLHHVRNISTKQIKFMLKDFFHYDSIYMRKQGYRNTEQDLENIAVKKRHRASNYFIYHKKQRKILKKFISLKKLIDAPTKNKKHWKNTWLAYRDLVHTLLSRYYGFQLLRTFLNIGVPKKELDQGIFAYGEIQNIGDHITMLERPHGYKGNLRNAGKHWGNFSAGKDKMRVIQYFLKYEDPTRQVPIYTPLLIDSRTLLGILETGQPANHSGHGI